MDKSENNHSLFCTKLTHNDIHRYNIFISANSVQFIDNSMLIYLDGRGMEPTEELFTVFSDLVTFSCSEEREKYDKLDVIQKYFISFFKGYISAFDDKIACAEHLKIFVTEFMTEHNFHDLYEQPISSPEIKHLIDQLPGIIDSIVGIETCDNNCEDENLLAGSSEEVILSE